MYVRAHGVATTARVAAGGTFYWKCARRHDVHFANRQISGPTRAIYVAARNRGHSRRERVLRGRDKKRRNSNDDESLRENWKREEGREGEDAGGEDPTFVRTIINPSRNFSSILE